ncbi:hypothetical protein M409DRAFT_21343 [Zasmidium cellare ATCC 36951]|uniref:Uncharacterized protein n=1 Tax=Zasmidium cellare ATCC 36951 TaxID=1080233 RepID=A0A6A6CN91_ZASCE|nr:uncharacterized protein M409DRAFT_21343 [Zasmidium cellare ATCC 36951]KAF2168594.1 hypothetical protein M409DRAFT_21343 [Zasmidium cellare ATCC 36951]
MCRWVQHHYGACRHQDTFLEAFCPDSTAVTTSPPDKKARRNTLAPGSFWTPDEGERPTGGDRARGQAGSSGSAGASSSTSRPPPSTSNKRSSKHRNVLSKTFPEHSFTPIPEETAEDIASLEQQRQNRRQPKPPSPRRFSEQAQTDMAGLAPFGKSTFRHLMGGAGSSQLATPVTTAKHHNGPQEMTPDLNQQGGSLRIRQSGIRDRSDESYDLPHSNEILQHITQSCGGDFTPSRIGTDPLRESSCGSDVQQFATHDAASNPRDSIDAIERDLDLMKTEITTLRVGESKQPPSMEEFPQLPSLRSKIPVPQAEAPPEEPVYHSRAAALQARHERQEKEKRERLAREKLERERASPERPPGAEQFPGLGTPSSTSSQRTALSSAGSRGGRKTSWATIASSGMKAAVENNAPGKRSSIGSAGVSTVSASRTSRGSISSFNSPQPVKAVPNAGADPQLTSSEVGDSSVIISPQKSRINTPSVGTVKPSQSTCTLGKQSPRFAQPTQATTRRVDETLRKDSTTSKASPEGSPTKSTRTLTQSPKKRAALPSNWTLSPDSSPSKQSFVTTLGSIHSSPSRSRDAPSSPETKAPSPAHSKADSPEQGLRKKTSSYMSPTKATAQRTIETLGQETIKQSPPRLSKAAAKIDTNVSPATAIMSPMENTPPLVAPLSGSTLRSGSPVGFEQLNITERVMQQLRTGRPPPLADVPDMTPAGTATRTASSSTASVFNSPIAKSGRSSRRATVGSPIAEMVAAKAREAGFPQVANTTVKRRGSHGHLLTPIVKRLGKEGLLRFQEGPLASVPEQALQSDLLAMDRSNLPPSLPTMPMAVEPGGRVVAPTVLPPHMVREMSQAAAHNPFWNLANAALTAAGIRPPNPTTGFLRATAEEFKPMGQLQNVGQQNVGKQDVEQQNVGQQNVGQQNVGQQNVGQLNVGQQIDPLQRQDMLGYHSKRDWDNLDPAMKETIRMSRQVNIPGGRMAPVRRPHDISHEVLHGTSHSAYLSPGPVVNNPSVPGPQDWLPTRLHQAAGMNQAAVVPLPPSPTIPSNENKNVFIGKPTPDPYVVETGAVLKPELNQATNSIQWFKEAADGSKEIIHFGRAAAPDAGTPEISPTSNDTSPPKFFTPSPGSARRWRIGSLHDNKYGWKGGDGLEISFRGSGSNAERDPNPPSDVNFGNNQDVRGPNFNNGARFIGGEKNDGSDSPPLAPRSREQWAKLMGYERVPCRTLKFEAREAVPRPPLWPGDRYGPFGFCKPCYPMDVPGQRFTA